MEENLKVNIDEVLAGAFLYFTEDDYIDVDELNIYLDRIKQELYWRDICYIVPDVSYLENRKSKYFHLEDNVVCLNKLVTRDTLRDEIQIDEDLFDTMTSENVMSSATWEIVLKRKERKLKL